MVVALRPEIGDAGDSGHLELFQSLGEDHQKNVVRWALANRARVSEEARVALNNALIGNVAVRGFQDSGVPDAPAIMLIQPARNAALVIDALAQAMLAVWQESRPELRGIVENEDAENLAETIASTHPQYSSDDVSLMIALTAIRDVPVEDVLDEEEQEDEPADAAELPESTEPATDTQRMFDDFLAELVILPADCPEWDGPLDQLIHGVTELKAKKAREYEEAHGVGSRIAEVLGAHADLLSFFEWDADERLPNAAGPWGNAEAVGNAIDAAAELLTRYEALRETGATYSEEARRVTERAELHPQILEALAAFAEATALPEPQPAIEEVVPENDDSGDSMEATSDAAAEDETDGIERQYLRGMLKVLLQENDELRAAAESAHKENAEIETVAEPEEEPEPEQAEATAEPPVVVDEQEPEEEPEPEEAEATAEPPVVVDEQEPEEEPEEAEATAEPPVIVDEQEPEEEPEAEQGETIAAPPDFGDVASVLDFVESRWPEGLRLALNGSSDRRLYFDQPNQVYSALEWLATTYRNSRTGEKLVANLDVSLFTTCGWRYRPFQSEVTVGKYRSDYQTTDNDKKYALEEHIGRGTGRTPGQIRIAFSWDEERKTVIVGYIGRHQRTDAG